MPQTISVIPDPKSLIESMRAVGYTVETAIADLIDNSLSAQSSRIFIEYDVSPHPFVSILDNGDGMTLAELTTAMRHGSRNPSEVRAADDLGRFGLGLKTASLSQCRKLTVVSKKDGSINALCWDLDYVAKVNEWVVIVPTESEVADLPLVDSLKAQENGTLVVWQHLDRLLAEASIPADEMRTRMSPLHAHLSFVFHRFRMKEAENHAVKICVNGLPLKPVDPFLRSNTFTQRLESQKVNIGSSTIAVHPYVLPHMNRLTGDDTELAGGRDGLRNSQGFYVYRSRRLVIWGTWFRLVPKEEFFKLTRVQVDIPNSLDSLWALDIKKSVAYPPEIIRHRLRDLIPNLAGRSRTIITYEGRKTAGSGDIEPIWERNEPAHGAFRYLINPSHPLVRKLAHSLGAEEQRMLSTVIDLIAAALPLEPIYSDMCADKHNSRSGTDVAELKELAVRWREITGAPSEEIIELDPFVRFPQHHAAIIAELNK